MGCDIHLQADRKVDGKWQEVPGNFFDWRSYSTFGFLAGVRNYSAVTPISPPRGLPDDHVQPEDDFDGCSLGDHSFSWLSLEELLAFNYDAPVEDRRVTVVMPGGWTNGGATAEPGGGEITTYREFLGESFFEELAKLKAAGAERVVFGFDS